MKARPQAATRLLANALIAAWVGLAPFGSSAKPPPNTPETVSRSELPVEAQATERLIRQGGPFPYTRDGSTFANRERLLPLRFRGYYREYTVASPGSSGRGARRLVCGGAQPSEPDDCFYTADHYSSFKRLVK